ncbi:CBS domain-containing protein [Ectothiorhodosinus mongolicus]|uniref:CBS domain-containing protein n=1 Tax=Ectothiorhodosinus mongolicus TaxID=233100 RepID=A0A1R3VY31_9GAMM|nr:nucleotidyltransferase family protein [Ectothiorhodosinus mongolicus]ULX56803.1 nucleotidyl transferase [Ectothiorhodosinus mongolicus]SIT68389.1 CBS domain-containing protein [Ectothiorhodosinus mongolicus]
MTQVATNSWKKAVILQNASLRDAARNLTESSQRIVLVIDDSWKLIGTVSDGDIRRGLLRGVTLDSDVTEVVHKNPLVAPEGISPSFIRELMAVNKVQQIPEVDGDGRIVCLHTWDEFITKKSISNKMVIMAGGKGTRLRPHTENCPKPMLLVGGRPILQHIIERARDEGFSEFILSVNYLAQMIEEYFGDGSILNVKIRYVREQSPLGTAGSLSMISELVDEPFIVTNGDVITDIRYSEILEFHKRQESIATMAVRLHEWQHPFGVVQVDGLNIVGFEEKPIARSHINAGVYALSPVALQELNDDEFCDMPTLFERLQARSLKTVAYPMHEPWLDVGRHEDLSAANEL